MKIKIRPARKEDSKEIIRLITELAKFEKLTPPDSKARQRLINDAFSKNPPFKILLAECDQKIAGYAFYFFTYSTFLAKRSLYLEDIYIIENFRNLNLGKLFMKKLQKKEYFPVYRFCVRLNIFFLQVLIWLVLLYRHYYNYYVEHHTMQDYH